MVSRMMGECGKNHETVINRSSGQLQPFDVSRCITTER